MHRPTELEGWAYLCFAVVLICAALLYVVGCHTEHRVEHVITFDPGPTVDTLPTSRPSSEDDPNNGGYYPW